MSADAETGETRVNREDPRYRLEILPDELVAIEMAPWQDNSGRPIDGVYVVDFAVRDIALGSDGIVHYRQAGAVSFMEATQQIAAAGIEWHGSLKWDGCVNYLYEQDVMRHGCGIDSRERELSVWRRIYEMGAEMMADKWMGD